jgi:uncharacterized protein (DUF433 family)
MVKVVNIDQEVLGGTPVFSGTRVPIKNLFDYLEAGSGIDEFLDDFDTVTKEQALQVLNLSEIALTTPMLYESIAG